MLELTLNGEQVQLLPEGALYWERAGTLVIADPHFGKDDIFRRAGVAIPRGPTLRDLERVGNTVRATHARRLIIVGDFVHGRSERGDDLPRQFALWRRRHPDLPVLLVAGNHDRHEDWTAWRDVLEVRAGSLHEGPFVFAHEPQADPRGYVLAGHLHRRSSSVSVSAPYPGRGAGTPRPRARRCRRGADLAPSGGVGAVRAERERRRQPSDDEVR